MRDAHIAAGKHSRVGCMVTMFLIGSGFSGGISSAQAPVTAAEPQLDEFHLIGAIGERLNSNPTYVSDSSSPDADYVSDLRLEISRLRRTERTEWSLRFVPFYTSYRQNNQLDSGNYTFDFDGNYDLSRRMKLVLAQHGEFSRNPLYVARFDTGQVPVLTQESKRWSSRPSATLETEISRALTLQTGVSAGVNRYEDPGLADSETFSGTAGLVKDLDREQAFSTSYAYSGYRFTVAGQPEVNPTSHGLLVGWSRTAEGRGRIAFSAGAALVNQGSAQKTRPIGEASYRRTFRRVEVSAGFRQGLSTDSGTPDLGLVQDLYVALAGTMGRLVSWGFVGNYGTRTSFLDTEGEQDLTYIGGAVRGEVSLHQRLSLLGEVSRRQQNNAQDTGGAGSSPIPSGDVTVSWIFVGLVFRMY